MTTVHHASILTGGTTGCLDTKAISTLTDNDLCLVANSGALYWYRFNASGTAAESSPTVIRPDDYVSAGVWELQQPSINTVTLGRREIIGGEIYSVTPNVISDAVFNPCSCWDETGTIFLSSSSTITGINWGIVPAAFYSVKNVDLYFCRLVSSGVCAPRMYVRGEDAPEDDSAIDAWRWIDFTRAENNLSAREWVCSGGLHSFINSGQAVLSDSVTTSYAVIDHSTLLPVDHVAAIEYGARDAATAATILASEDGTNVSFVVGTTVTTASNTNLDAWGAAAAQKAGLKPFNPNRTFKSTSGTLDLLVQQVVLKR